METESILTILLAIIASVLISAIVLADLLGPAAEVGALSSFHRVAAVKIEAPLRYINTGLGGTYQRIEFYDEQGVKRSEVTVHLTDSATPMPVFDGTLK